MKIDMLKLSLVQAKLVYDRSPNKYTETKTSEKDLANSRPIIIGVNANTSDNIEKSYAEYRELLK